MPVTMPVDAPTVATAGVSALHVPPGVAFANVVVNEVQRLVVPVIAAGMALTVSDRVVTQPAPRLYKMVTVPGAMPVIIPVAEPMVAVVIPLLLQLPPVEALPSVAAEPTQIADGPVIGAGVRLTVTTEVAKQPEM